MADFISRSCRGHNGLLSVGITQSARVDDLAVYCNTSLTVRVTIGCGGRWPRDGNPTCKRGSSGVMADFISRSCRGHNGLLSVGITQSARVDDWPCTAIPP